MQQNKRSAVPLPDTFSLNDYFKRTGYTGTPDTDLATLTELMRHQLYTIPFENADIWRYNKTVSLQADHIVQKLLHMRRGGYCYEVNGLFCMVLETLGFTYTILGARPRYNYEGRRPITHMCILVYLGEEGYLCDLGFGEYGIREPLPLSATDIPIHQNGDTFMLLKQEDEYLLQMMIEHEFKDLYTFSPVPFEWIDFELASHFNSTSVNTIFTRKRLAFLQNAQGRIFLIDDEFSILRNNNRESSTLSENDYDAVMEEHFGITLQ